MEHVELIRRLAAALERLGIRYFITGSSATIFFGEPRFTNDIDVVADLAPHQLQSFLADFPPSDFYVSRDAALDAIQQRGQFNIIHPASGLKIDVVVPRDDAFNRSGFERVVRVHPGNFDASFASPEDVMIKKMQYFEEGGSEKHLRDIAGVLKIMEGRIDRDYIAQWVERLGLQDVWQRLENSLSD